ncbi:MAG TPA: hypothetical protein VFS34_00945 [Thermoanaerobaculia bacterium]|nr:hypothetical protein [Thermoanaerobaculia bacterium]
MAHDPGTPVRPLRAVALAVAGFVVLATAAAAGVPPSAPPPSPPEPARSPARTDESAARERVRVLRAAAESGRDADIDAFVAFVLDYVGQHPGSPLSRHLRRDLPRSLKSEARRAERTGNGRRALALYRIYERLPFLPPDREVGHRRAALESAFVAARISPEPHPPAILAHAGREVAIPVDWPGSGEGVSGELHFRKGASGEWRSVPILAGPDGRRKAIVPAEEVAPPSIAYWTEMRDAAGHVRRSGSADAPIVLRVLER